ncbi:choice-of-anchor J domain-containing protein [uncultured Flavobacterium sp.]|uniref:T9SS-dependent choice-of-anchor J family protein n=1 Tax=uncultured Flavobacterium sp. TaxID=165435 RepID=UPI0025E30717|nr:choice-of-anchor J domain-containing protein [uncultured Flavobacterium sp.]
MKNGLLLLMLSGFAMSYGQLATEGFENNGDALPVGWTRINVSGPAWHWNTVFGDDQRPQYQGDRVAYIGREGSAEGTSEDWLVTKQILVPDSGELTFYSRLRYEGDQLSTYRVMIHIGNTPSDIASYTQLQQWTELQINPEQLQYNKVTVPIPAAYFGQQAYIAFVMNGDFGDDWLVDAVGVQNSTMNNNKVKTNSLSFFPNPVKDHLTISGADEILSVKIFDSLGSECLIENDKGMIDMSGLAAGMYIIEAISAKGAETHKIIKN